MFGFSLTVCELIRCKSGKGTSCWRSQSWDSSFRISSFSSNPMLSDRGFNNCDGWKNPSPRISCWVMLQLADGGISGVWSWIGTFGALPSCRAGCSCLQMSPRVSTELEGRYGETYWLRVCSFSCLSLCLSCWQFLLDALLSNLTIYCCLRLTDYDAWGCSVVQIWWKILILELDITLCARWLCWAKDVDELNSLPHRKQYVSSSIDL